MSNDVIISVENVGKKFCRSLKRTLVYGVQDVAKDVFGIASESTGLRRDEFWALNDVSFEVKRGECLGLIGSNGAGKSTLLKLLNGVILPDKGTIRVHGRVGALLELGAGFHPTLTGRENIHLSGAIRGVTKREIEDKFDDIVDFADLGKLIDSPVKYYSSGMYLRLAYAIAAHIDQDVLLIDESWAVGDINFRAKCVKHIQEFLNAGGSIIFVSHELNAVASLCQSTLLLRDGQIWQFGETDEILNFYYTHGALRQYLDGVNHDTGEDQRQNIGPDSPLSIVRVKTLNNEGAEQDLFDTGEKMTICVEFLAHQPVNGPVFGVAIRNTHGARCHAITTLADNWKVEELCGEGKINLHYPQLNLLGGRYSVAVSVSDPSGSICWQSVGLAAEFSVNQKEMRDSGQIYLPHVWCMNRQEGCSQFKNGYKKSKPILG
jgi:lipopolysaccharide transport system ATP-binding protein